MKHQHLLTCALAFAATAILSACGGGGNNSPDTPPETRTGAQLIRDGQSLSAHHTAAIKVAASEGSGELIRTNWDQFDILRADALQAVLQVNGQTIRFTKQADEPFASDNTKIDYDVLDEEGQWQGTVGLRYIHPDRQEHMVVALLRDDRTTTQWDGIAVLGNRSRQLDDTRTGTATYDGNVKGYFEVYKSSEGQIWNRYKDRFYSDNGQLIADFDTNTISGQITDWYTDIDDQKTNFDITATLEPTPITADGFTGQVTMSGPDFDATSSNISYEGSFYGPQAEDVGGVFTGTVDEVRPAIGYFTAHTR